MTAIPIPVPPWVYPCDAAGCDCQQPDHHCECWDCCGVFNILRAQIDAATGQELARLEVGYPEESDAYERKVREFATCRFCGYRIQIVEVGEYLSEVEVDERAESAYDDHLDATPRCNILAIGYDAMHADPD